MKIWRYINILSLDVAAGAMIGCAFFGRLLGIDLLPHAFISLGLIVWIIYTLDHLMDARRTAGEPSTERHRFHKRHGGILMTALAIAIIGVILEAFFVRLPVLFAGVVIALLVLGYIFFQASLRFTKEVIGGLLYTAGILVGPWSLLDRSITTPELILILLYALTAMINLMLFSLIDRDSDLLDKRVSIATTLGTKATQWVLLTEFVIVAGLCAWLVRSFPGHGNAAITILAMNTLLLIILRHKEYFRVDDRYRRIGDLAFLVPGIYLIYAYAVERV